MRISTRNEIKLAKRTKKYLRKYKLTQDMKENNENSLRKKKNNVSCHSVL